MKKFLSVALAASILLSAGGNTLAATGNEVVNTGNKYLGTPYQYGASLGNTRSFDCSSFTAYIFSKHGVSLPRTSNAQLNVGVPVSKANLQVGDLVFFKTTSAVVGHVGIYVGGGKMIGSASSTGVATVSMNNSYWGPRYVTARRVLDKSTAKSTVQTVKQVAAAKKAVAPKPTTAIGMNTHTVVRGDTLSLISRKYGTSVSALKSLNGLTSDMIYVGEKLQVNGKKAAAAPAKTKNQRYKVKAGDSLWKISHLHGTSVSALMKANKLKSTVIHPGQNLVVPK